MSKRENYEAKAESLLGPIVERVGVNIYDVEYVKEGTDWYLRVYIDKPEGVNIIDCEKVSRALSDALDKEDFIPDAYILEVSSPGLGRTLKKDKHLQKSIGMEVEVKLFKAIDKQKDFTGYLESFNDEVIVISDEQEKELEFDTRYESIRQHLSDEDIASFVALIKKISTSIHRAGTCADN